MSEATNEVTQGHHFAPWEENTLRHGTWKHSLVLLVPVTVKMSYGLLNTLKLSIK